MRLFTDPSAALARLPCFDECPAYHPYPTYNLDSTSTLISDIIQIIVLLAVLKFVALIILSLCGIIIDWLKWPGKIMQMSIILILAVYVYIDYYLMVDLIDFDQVSVNFMINSIILILIGLFQIYILFKLNDYVLDWLKGKSAHDHKPKINWNKLFIKGIIGIIVTFVLYFFLISITSTMSVITINP